MPRKNGSLFDGSQPTMFDLAWIRRMVCLIRRNPLSLPCLATPSNQRWKIQRMIAWTSTGPNHRKEHRSSSMLIGSRREKALCEGRTCLCATICDADAMNKWNNYRVDLFLAPIFPCLLLYFSPIPPIYCCNLSTFLPSTIVLPLILSYICTIYIVVFFFLHKMCC